MLTAEERARVTKLLEDAGGKDICVVDFEGAALYVNRPGVRVRGLRDDVTLNLVLFGRNVSVLRNDDGSALLLLPPRPPPPLPSKGFWGELKQILKELLLTALALIVFLVLFVICLELSDIVKAHGIWGAPEAILERVRLFPCSLERFAGRLEASTLWEIASALVNLTGVVCSVPSIEPTAAPPGSTTHCIYDAATRSVSCS